VLEGSWHSVCCLSAFRPWPAVNHPDRERSLGNSNDPLDPGHSSQSHGHQSTQSREAAPEPQKPPRTSSELSASTMIHRPCDLLLTTEARDTDHHVLHGPGSLLLKMLDRSVSNPLLSTSPSQGHPPPDTADSQTCNCSLFSGPQSGSVSTQTPLKWCLGIVLQNMGTSKVNFFCNVSLSFWRSHCQAKFTLPQHCLQGL
jgi:hypothetical protein